MNTKFEKFIKKKENILNKCIENGKITEFDIEFMDNLDNYVFNGIPISFHIKYFNPIDIDVTLNGKCFDRALLLFIANSDAEYVTADIKELELHFGKDYARHAWIELNGYVYDPTSLLRYEKDIWYKLQEPTNIKKHIKDDYGSETLIWYENVRNKKKEDYMPDGKFYHELGMTIPLYQSIAEKLDNPELNYKLNRYLNEIHYNEEEYDKYINDEFQKVIVKK